MSHRSPRPWCALAVSSLVLLIIPLASLAGGLKKVVAVSRFENRTNYAGQVSINDAMADQLADALVQSGQFTVVERQTVNDALDEQDFASSGRVQKAKSARTGKMVAAQILIKGTITEFEGASESSGQKMNFGAFGFSNKKTSAHVGLIIRLIDSTTGEVIDSVRAEGKAQSGGVGFKVFGYSKASSKKTPMGKATQVAIDNAVALIAQKLAALPFQSRVIKVKPDELYIAAGERDGAEIGDTFTVFGLGEELIDPYTGENLGSDEEEIGIVEITQVKERYSKARPVGALANAKPGDIVRAR